LLQSFASAAFKVTAWVYNWSVTVAGTGTWSVILTGCVEECCRTWGLPEEGVHNQPYRWKSQALQ